MPRSGYFCGDNGNRQTDYFTPAHAHGVVMQLLAIRVHLENKIASMTKWHCTTNLATKYAENDSMIR